MLRVARALGNSGEGGRHCCPGAIPTTKRTFTRCCRPTILAPHSIFGDRALMNATFCPQPCRNCPLGARGARHRLKQLKVLLSLAIRRGPAGSDARIQKAGTKPALPHFSPSGLVPRFKDAALDVSARVLNMLLRTALCSHPAVARRGGWRSGLTCLLCCGS